MTVGARVDELITQSHHLCDAGWGPCLDQVDELNRKKGVLSGHDVPPHPRYEKRPAEPLHPLAGSCGYCNEDDTARDDMPRCSRCKIIRREA